MPDSSDIANTVVINYLNCHFDLFTENLEKSKIDPDQEAIHQYRVSVKRIRAIFRILNKIYPEKILPDDLLIPLREIFKAGGPIRDEQVQLEIVNSIERDSKASFPLINNYFQRKIDNSYLEFRNRSAFFDENIPTSFPKKVIESLQPLKGSELQSSLYSMTGRTMEKLSRKRLKLGKPDKLHRFRTRLKQLFYVLEMLYNSNLQPKIDQYTFNRLKSFGQQLGTWHDHYQLLSQNDNFFDSDSGLLEESSHLKKLLFPIHDSLFQEIQDRLRDDDLLVINFLQDTNTRG